tara:strand:- start:74 stop:433 length:360 start_codon:yes stop_codon:yes gene_type:complete
MSLNIISISNTTSGSVNPRTQEYEADTDRTGKVIYSAERFRVNTTPDSTMPAQLSSAQISKLIKFAESKGVTVSVKTGVKYELSRKVDKSSSKVGEVERPPITQWYFRPERQPMGEFEL